MTSLVLCRVSKMEAFSRRPYPGRAPAASWERSRGRDCEREQERRRWRCRSDGEDSEAAAVKAAVAESMATVTSVKSPPSHPLQSLQPPPLAPREGDKSAVSYVSSRHRGERDPPGNAGWRTVVEPIAGSVSYAFTPPPPVPAADDASALPTGNLAPCGVSGVGGVRGRRRVFVDSCSTLRGVLRPSDVATVARVLLSAPTATATLGGAGAAGGRGQSRGRGHAKVSGEGQGRSHEGPPAPPQQPRSPPPTLRSSQKASEGISPPAIVDLDLRASGAGLSVRLEDDSGTHFVSPQQYFRDALVLAPPSFLPSEGSGGGGGVGFGRERVMGDEDRERISERVPERLSERSSQRASSPRAPGGSSAARGEWEGVAANTHVAGPSACVNPAFGSPAQPVVKVVVGAWDLGYSRVSGSGGLNGSGGGGGDSSGGDCKSNSGSVVGSGNGGRRNDEGVLEENDVSGGEKVETATASISAVRVIDLLQRDPCRAAFRDLLVIDAQPPLPSRPARHPPHVSRWPSEDDASICRKWLEDEEEEEGEEGEGRKGRNEIASAGGDDPCSPSDNAAATASGGSDGNDDATARRQRRPPEQATNDDGIDGAAQGLPSSSVPLVLVSYRKVTYSGAGAASATTCAAADVSTCTGAASAHASASAASGGGGGGGTVASGSAASDAAASACGAGGRATGGGPGSSATSGGGANFAENNAAVSVGIEAPVAVNWNPRTVVALWRIHAALTAASGGETGEAAAAAAVMAATRSKSDANADCVGGARGSGSSPRWGGLDDGAEDTQAAQEARRVDRPMKKPLLSAWTEIRVGARQGLEVCMPVCKGGGRLAGIDVFLFCLVVKSANWLWSFSV